MRGFISLVSDEVMRKDQIRQGIADFFALPQKKRHIKTWIVTRLPYWGMFTVYSATGLLNNPFVWGIITFFIICIGLYFYFTAK